MISKIITTSFVFVLVCLASFGQDCTNINACNFNSSAIIDDGSCVFPGDSCDDGDPTTQNDTFQLDCVCQGFFATPVGCTNNAACNFDPLAQADDGSCLFQGNTCDDGNPFTTEDSIDGNCQCSGLYQLELNMFDLTGDGWTGTQLSIIDTQTDNQIELFELSGGTDETVQFFLPEGCYEFITTEDANPIDVSFTLDVLDGNGGENLFGLAGDTQPFAVGGISGCLDPEALNYNPEATCDAGGCFICGVDGECEAEGSSLKAKPCYEIEICGIGHYKVEGTVYSGELLAGDPCVKIPLADPPGSYVIRVWPGFGAPMSLYHNGQQVNTNTLARPECIRVKGCVAVPFDWPNEQRVQLTMHDNCGNGWQGIRYVIRDQQYMTVAEGTLAEAEYGDQTTVGIDLFDLPDGCYELDIITDSHFYPGLRYELDYIDQGSIGGSIPTEPVGFSRNSQLCTFGCTDENAVNYDPEADASCFGDNSCCKFIPSNNECSEASAIVSGQIYSYDHSNASQSQALCSSAQGADTWYVYQTICDELVTVSGTSADGILISVAENICPMIDADIHACSVNGDTRLNEVTFFAEANSLYFIQISSDASINPLGKGTFRLDNNGCLGCTDMMAYNYDSSATLDDGSCLVESSCAGDLNGDNKVTAADLTIFLSSYGEDCTE